MYYNPFIKFEFNDNFCFLSGEHLDDNTRKYISAFPEWILERYNLNGVYLSMLGGNWAKYEELVMPASERVYQAIKGLDIITKEAFTKGYDAVKELDEIIVFQWMARLVYGTLYSDMVYAYNKKSAENKAVKFSPIMQRRLKNLHLMLQSLLTPIAFKDFTPWSIFIVPVKYSKDIFNYKDEAHKLNFCLGMNGFGIVACLQDNYQTFLYHQDIIQQIGDQTLHPIQFEELYGRFMYANYLLREVDDYQIAQDENKILFQLPNDLKSNLPQYAKWDDTIYAQVLANLWKPWGFEMKDIHRFPNPPISFLINERTNKLIDPQTVNQPF